MQPPLWLAIGLHHINPALLGPLQDATDSAMDGVATGLDSWRCLQASFGWQSRLQALQSRLPRGRWLAWARALVSRVRQRSADRQVSATAAFVLAQRYAAAQLAALLDAEAAAQQTKGSQGPGGDMVMGTTGWRPLLLTDIQDIDWAHRDALLADVLRSFQRSGSPREEQLRVQAMDRVLTEVRQAEAAAAEHLQALRAAHPHSAQRVVTLQTAISLLDRKVDLLAALQSAGMLEPREVGPAHATAARRLRALRLFHSHL